MCIRDRSRFGLKGSPTRLHKVIVPSEAGRKGEVFRGSTAETTAKIVDAFEEGGVLENIR